MLEKYRNFATHVVIFIIIIIIVIIIIKQVKVGGKDRKALGHTRPEGTRAGKERGHVRQEGT